MADSFGKSEGLVGVRAMLRRSTKMSHEDLHVHPLLRDLNSDRLTVASYRRIIEAFYGFYQPLEPRLIAAADRLGCAARYDHQIRTAWLMDDLVELGCSRSEMNTLPCIEEPTVIATREQLAGYLYVIEGSTLGGATIVRKLDSNLNFNGSRATRFFRGYGSQTIPRWQRVCHFIETTCGLADGTNDVIDETIRTFSLIRGWLTDAWENNPR